MPKQITGKGREFGGLYILDHTLPRLVSYSGVTTSFGTHCVLGHPSLFLLKKLCPQFSNLPLWTLVLKKE